LLGALLIAACWLLYRSFVHNGRTLLRLQALERLQGDRSSTETPRFRWPELFRSLAVNDSYDMDNIVPNVVFGDEYRMRGEHFEPGDVVIDVGANIGTFSLLCHLLGSRAIFCYEPGARNFQLLERNVGALPGVHLFQAAVWRSDGNGLQPLILSEGSNSGAHSVMAAGHVTDFVSQRLLDSSRPGYAATSMPLDAILERFGRVKLLKIDCEGSEFPILLTSQRLDRVERVVGEIHEYEEDFVKVLDPHARVAGYAAYRAEHLVARLGSFGFSVTTRHNDQHIYLFDARRETRA
jgi:FkbM family methyltransferase